MPDIELLGAVYPDVPAVDLPKSPTGTARFFDLSGTTATAKDVIAGKYFYDENGVLTMGELSLAPDVLYYNSSGTTGTVTLSASAANYDHMRIYFFKTNDLNQCASVDLYNPNGKYAALFVINPRSANSDMWTAGRMVYINGTSITNQNYAEAQIGATTNGNGNNNVSIYRVEAWNDSTNFANIYSSTNTPDSNTGVNGDIWMVTE